MKTFIAAGCSALLGGTAVAGPPAVDGTRDAVYGPVASLQNNSTGFGDNTSDHVGYAFGSELDGGSAVIAGGSLFIHLGGNIESNHNKIELFIDARAGGQNSILGINPDVSFSALQRMGDDGTGNGLTFDDGIEPDLYLSITCGDNDTDSGIVSYIDYAELRTYGDGVGDYAGSGSSYNLEGVDYIEPSVGDYGIRVAINNSNIGGVIGGDGEDCGAPDEVIVDTGIEIEIPLVLFDWDHEGLPFDDVKICAFVNAADHAYVSNQILNGLGGTVNLGEPRLVNFANIDGPQYFSIGDETKSCIPAITGACCFANGECWEGVTAEHCDASRGLWIGEDSICEECDLGGGNDCPTDIDDSGTTGVDDLLLLIGNFGNVCP
ncbi:MAG: hypothetical protein GY894_06470 [Planctomycetes bacterium]|nr:hypothetical protein [Planctomycetota bacterium]